MSAVRLQVPPRRLFGWLTMHPYLVDGIAFVLDFVATAAATKSLIELEKRKAARVANWQLVVNLSGGIAMLLVVLTDNIPAFFWGCAGAWLADYWITERQRRREANEKHRPLTGE